MLVALAERYPMRFTRAQWGLLCKLRHTGGTFGTYLSKLRGEGLVEDDGRLFAATAVGLEYSGAVARGPRDSAERIAMWRECLSGKVLDMFDSLVEAFGPVSRERLAEWVGLTAGAGTFGTYLSKLSANGLVEKLPGGTLRAARHLFQDE